MSTVRQNPQLDIGQRTENKMSSSITHTLLKYQNSFYPLTRVSGTETNFFKRYGLERI